MVQGVGVAVFADNTTPSANQSAQVGLVWRIARFGVYLQNGGAAADFKDVDPWDKTPAVAPVSTVPTTKAPVKEKVMKMANVLDQCDDEAVPPEDSDVLAWTQRYVTTMGSYPDEEEEPADLQLGALHRRVVDFAVWQPYGRRITEGTEVPSLSPCWCWELCDA